MYLVSLQWPVVQLDFSDGMHMTENSYMPQSARMRAQIQANTGKYRQFWTPEILHGVDLTKFDGGAHVMADSCMSFAQVRAEF